MAIYFYILLLLIIPGAYMLYNAIPLQQTEYILSGLAFLGVGVVWAIVHVLKGKEWIREKLGRFF